MKFKFQISERFMLKIRKMWNWHIFIFDVHTHEIDSKLIKELKNSRRENK